MTWVRVSVPAPSSTTVILELVWPAALLIQEARAVAAVAAFVLMNCRDPAVVDPLAVYVFDVPSVEIITIV